MATYDEIIKRFHRDIERLEDTVESKNVELRLIESELQETLTPSLLGTQINCTVAEMIGELLEFEKKKGVSEKTTFSKQRLIGLMFDTEKLNSLTQKLNTLQLSNRFMAAEYRLLRIENMKLKEQIKRAEDAVNF
jgi:hypothetical protein